MTVVVMLTSAATALLSTSEVSNLMEAERAWEGAGGYVRVIEAAPSTDGGQLSTSMCETLSAIEGVDASFAASVTDAAMTSSNAPGALSTVVEASAGFADFFGLPVDEHPTVVLTDTAADTLAASDGDTIRISSTSLSGDVTSTSQLVKVTRLTTDVLGPSIAGASIIVNKLEGPAQQCYVRTDATHVSAVEGLVGVLLATDSSTPAAVRPLLLESEFSTKFDTAYAARTTAWLWVAAGALLATLWAVLQATRRTTWAIYATFGADVRARTIMQFTEWACGASVGLLGGWATGIAVGVAFGYDAATVVTQTTWQTVGVLCIAGLGAIAGAFLPVGTLLSRLKDKS